MLTYKAVIIQDSINRVGERLTTMELTYPRFIHAEVMTHRDRARNAASSRAIPWNKMKDHLGVVPIAFGMEKPGMQTGEPLPEHLAFLAKAIWEEGERRMRMFGDALHNIGETYDRLRSESYDPLQDVLGIRIVDPRPNDPTIKVHKSICNRLTEPWMWITVIMSATSWKNFFRLRCHGDAEIHFQRIAGMAKDALEASAPMERRLHLPYVTPSERSTLSEGVLKRISTARCARVSYKTHDGEANVKKDLTLFERLVLGSGFGHWSPHEHVATADPGKRSGCFVGWRQFRKEWDNECAD